MDESRMFTKATNDPASKDAQDALKLVEYLEQENARLLILEKRKENPSFGARLSDRIAQFGGSWAFITSFLLVLVLWVTLNVTGIVLRWDPYPFILLNLCLSTIAALQAPVILMSQNRQAERDRIRADIDAERDRLDLEMDIFAAKVTRDAFVKLQDMDARLKRIEKKVRAK